MKAEYDFSQSRRNPYAQKLRRQVTIRLDNDIIEYFKNQAQITGIPYQKLINLYLSDCVQNNRTLSIGWS